MAQIEEELDDLVMGHGQYARQFASDGIRVFLERHAVIPRSETCDGGITDRGDYVTAGSGPESASGSITDNPNWLRNRAMNLLTIADYLENRERILADVKAAKAAALGKRRDELAQEFTAVNSYSGQLPYTQNLINRIIDLEDAAK